ncbi:tyrosine-type recombinase/integrase [Microbacterium sp. HD4P20]|uniref:tyrosine-type recombinase/integrase n=1 Tax=Microbacterium sp. HD4P20 TaxID=2864874 RepID=UPI0020A5E4F4|nr:tyrosine-type recombinase/integrase [Microbacterium sp. HD4P20]MCP2637202.1 tyrosine-type recombinase/integrase [Microbacterium sp. HD4P20]
MHQSYSDHVMLAALLAARGSEVAGLRAGDVDWDNRIVWIRRQHYPGRGGLVIKQTKDRGDRPVRDATHWDNLAANLGFGNLTRHGLRRTGATWMADTVIALHVLQEILGHQSIETTDRTSGPASDHPRKRRSPGEKHALTWAFLSG